MGMMRGLKPLGRRGPSNWAARPGSSCAGPGEVASARGELQVRDSSGLSVVGTIFAPDNAAHDLPSRLAQHVHHWIQAQEPRAVQPCCLAR